MAITHRLIVGLGVSIATLFLGAPSALACDCVGPGSVSEAFWKTPVVFVGRVEAVGPIRSATGKGARSRTRFRVTEALRGTKTQQMDIFGYETDCDLQFSPGQDWLIYAFTRRDDRRLTTTSCTRSRPLSEAAEDLAYARKPKD
jgi:hypothetical protein